MTIYYLLFLALIATVGWSRIITGYGGPFDILNIVRDWLLPGKRPIQPELTQSTKEALEQWQIDSAQYEMDLEVYENYENHPRFLRTIRGTLYELLACNRCIVPYLTVFFVILAFIPAIGVIAGLPYQIALYANFSANILLTFFGLSGLAVVINERL